MEMQKCRNSKVESNDDGKKITGGGAARAHARAGAVDWRVINTTLPSRPSEVVRIRWSYDGATC